MKQPIVKLFKVALLLPLMMSLPSLAGLSNALYVKDISKNDIRGQLTKLKTANSIVIQDPAILKLLEEEHSFGQKMGELAYNQNANGRTGIAKDTADYILNGFTESHKEVTENNNRMKAHSRRDYRKAPIIPYARNWRDQKTSDGVVKSRFLSTAIGVNKRTNITPYQNVINLWPELKNAQRGNYVRGDVKRRFAPENAGKGPFRLLAVVNRMDLSGNLPRGSGPFGFITPRAFGEVHFIYGLVDKDYEKATKKAYPHTFQITYRLPPLDSKFNPQRQYQKFGHSNRPVPVGVATHEAFMMASGRAEWRVHNERWGRLWRQLSRLDIKKQRQQFANHLHAILERSATADNFLNMNSNTAVGGFYHTRRKALASYEFELKAYYANANNRVLKATDLEREAFRCAINAPYMRNLINRYMKTYPADNGYFKKPARDIMVWNPNFIAPIQGQSDYDLRKGNFNFTGRNSYMLASNLNEKNESDSHPALVGSGVTQQGNSRKKLLGCENSDHGKTPYTVFQKRNVITPVLARTKWNFIWDFPNRRGLPTVYEGGRHAFAIRTCSGCHGGETRTNGFHIENRLENDIAKTSAFLSERGVTTNRLGHRGFRYTYNTINHRKEWLYLSVEKKETIQAGYGLIRKSDKRFR